MSTEEIQIADSYHTRRLTTRAAALDLTERVLASHANRVILDFSGIEVLTRSFMDQFYHERAHEMRPVKKVVVRNLATNARSNWKWYLRARRSKKKVEGTRRQPETLSL